MCPRVRHRNCHPKWLRIETGHRQRLCVHVRVFPGNVQNIRHSADKYFGVPSLFKRIGGTPTSYIRHRDVPFHELIQHKLGSSSPIFLNGLPSDAKYGHWLQTIYLLHGREMVLPNSSDLKAKVSMKNPTHE